MKKKNFRERPLLMLGIAMVIEVIPLAILVSHGKGMICGAPLIPGLAFLTQLPGLVVAAEVLEVLGLKGLPSIVNVTICFLVQVLLIWAILILTQAAVRALIRKSSKS